jgi:hypothetical protein
MDAVTRGSRTARQVRDNLAFLTTARTADIDEVYVRDVDVARVLRTRGLVDVEVALVVKLA